METKAIKLENFTITPEKIEWGTRPVIAVGTFGIAMDSGHKVSYKTLGYHIPTKKEVIDAAIKYGWLPKDVEREKVIVITVPNGTYMYAYGRTYGAGYFRLCEPADGGEDRQYLSVNMVGIDCRTADLKDIFGEKSAEVLKKGNELTALWAEVLRKTMCYATKDIVQNWDESHVLPPEERETVKIIRQLRLYKDRCRAWVYKAESSTGENFYWVSPSSPFYMHEVFTDGKEKGSKNLIGTLRDYIKGYTTVYSEKEINDEIVWNCREQLSLKNSEDLYDFKQTLGFEDIETESITMGRDGSNVTFNKDIKKTIEDLLEFDLADEDHKALKEYFDKKYLYLSCYSGTRSPGSGITSPIFLSCYLSIKLSTLKGAATKAVNIKDLWTQSGIDMPELLAGRDKGLSKVKILEPKEISDNCCIKFRWGKMTVSSEEFVFCAINSLTLIDGCFVVKKGERYGSSRIHQTLFVYNKKRKTKGVYSRCGYGYDIFDRGVTPLVAGFSSIGSEIESLTRDARGDFSYYVCATSHVAKHEAYKETHVINEYKDDIDFKELFNKTNVEYINDHLESFSKIKASAVLDGFRKFDFNQLTTKKDRVEVADREYDFVRNIQKDNAAKGDLITDSIKERKLGFVALLVLMTSGHKLSEQLLKSELWNIYWVTLGSLYNSGTTNVLFKKATTYRYDCPEAYVFTLKNGSNLKKMTGLSAAQLRYVDSKIESRAVVIPRPWVKSSITEIHNVGFPLLFLGEEALGLVGGFSSLSEKTFAEICEATSEGVSVSPSGYIEGSSEPALKNIYFLLQDSDSAFYKFWDKLDLNGKVAFLKRYGNSRAINLFRDYLKMRNDIIEAKEWAKAGPSTRLVDGEIKTELSKLDLKHYPEKIEKAKRYIPFIKGMELSASYWGSNRIETEGDFVGEIGQKYEERNFTKKGGEILFNHNGAGQVVGAWITMTPEMNTLYLHDELSIFEAVYKQADKVDKFNKAVKRIKPLEWEDEETGLCIIAPSGISDLQREGGILEHCVASYVSPIADGNENVMFIRRLDMKEEPFFTMDIIDGEIREVSGWRNKSPLKDNIEVLYAESKLESYNKKFNVIKFLNRWVKHKGEKTVKELSQRRGTRAHA